MTASRDAEAEPGSESPLPPLPPEEGRIEGGQTSGSDRGLTSWDWRALGALLAVAFVLRFFSPIMPNFLTHPFQWPPVTNCVSHTTIDATGAQGTLCGLAYPYQRAGQNGQPPEGQIFDEIYFGVFAHDDLKGIQYCDPEPPASKLAIAAGEWSWGWFRATFMGARASSYVDPGNPASSPQTTVGDCAGTSPGRTYVDRGTRGDYADLGFNTFGWRLAPLLFGTLVVPLMYLLALRLWRNRFFALTAGILTCFDGMFFVQSRIGMIDMIPIFLIILAYFVFHVHLDSRRPRESIQTLLLAGVVIGLAISAKWISLAAWATILFFLACRIVGPKINLSVSTPLGSWRWREGPAGRLAVPGGASLAIYLPLLVVAFILIPSFIYLGSWIPFFTRGQFHNLGDLIRYQQWAYEYHANLTATHPYGSPWYSWPFLYHPVLYYYEAQGLGVDAGGANLIGAISNLGNPAIWWASIPCLLAMPYFIFRHRSYAAAFITLAFISQYLPWSRITRVIFLYHMFGGLPFMILALAFVLARIASVSFDFRVGWLRFVELRGELAITYVAIAIATVPAVGFGFLTGNSALVVACVELLVGVTVLGLVLYGGGRELAIAYVAVVVLAFAYFYPLWTALPIGETAYYGQSFYRAPNHEPHVDGKFWFHSWIEANAGPAAAPSPSATGIEHTVRAKLQGEAGDATQPGIPIRDTPGGAIRGYLVWGATIHTTGSVTGAATSDGQSTEWLQLADGGYINRSDVA